MAEEQKKQEWGFSSMLPWHPNGDRCIWCGTRDNATINRTYPRGQYQICQRCRDYDQRESEFDEKYPIEEMGEMTKEERQQVWAEMDEMKKDCPFDFFHCPFCGKKMLKYGMAKTGVGGFVLHSCRSTDHMDAYMADRVGGYEREATEEEKLAKEQAIERAKTKGRRR